MSFRNEAIMFRVRTLRLDSEWAAPSYDSTADTQTQLGFQAWNFEISKNDLMEAPYLMGTLTQTTFVQDP